MGFDLSQYEPVEERLARFWADHPEGVVSTKLLDAPEGSWIVFAEVYRNIVDERPAATGMAQEIINSSPVNRTSALENGETSAIGRALANLGYAPKGQRASREEMQKVERGVVVGRAAPAHKEAGGEAGRADPLPVEPPATTSTGDFWTDFAKEAGFPKAILLKRVRAHEQGKNIQSLDGLDPSHPAAAEVITWAEATAQGVNA